MSGEGALVASARTRPPMIRARKGGPLGWLWSRYVSSKVRRSFRGVWARGALPSAEGGLLVYANHAGWWDGFIAHELAVAAGWDLYALMEERQLRRYPFLARLGAFSVVKGDAGSALETLRYAKGLLRAGKVVVIFPEGELRPGAVEPGPVARGVEVLARISGARCLPVGLRYAFLEGEQPDVLVEVGAPHAPAPLATFETNLKAVLSSVHGSNSLAGLTPLVRGRKGAAERWDAVRGLTRGAT